MKAQIGRAAMSIVGAACVVLGLSSRAAAHAGDDDPNHVHACIGNVSKIVRVVGVSGACITSPPVVAETPAHWSIQGPPGVPGATGAPGAPGAAGPQGLPGTNGLNGLNGASATFVGYFAGNQNGCPNGGAIFAVGSVNAYVCNGLNGNGATAPRADVPCWDKNNRYVDCRNGTVTDTVTGLIWLKDAACLGSQDWVTANIVSTALKDGDCGLTDHSSPGDWRLPTLDEWVATMSDALQFHCGLNSASGIELTNDAGNACLGDGSASSFTGVTAQMYWASSTVGYGYVGEAFGAFLNCARSGIGLSAEPFCLSDAPKSQPGLVWAVRSSAR